MDWIGHHNDIAHWALGVDDRGPTRVTARDWTFPDTDVYNTPHHYTIECEYEGGVNSSISSRNPQGLKLIGDQGWVFVRRGQMDASQPRWIDPQFDPGDKRVYHSDSHAQNFLDCVRTRRPCIAPAETAHRSITPGHLGYVSNALGRSLKWNPRAESVVDDDTANQLLSRIDYRAPWSA
jgi:predicted dehydrogenase